MGSASKMLAHARHLALFLVLVTVAESKKGQDPCQGYEHSDFRYKLTDPYDCRKFWMCSGGPKGNHFTCPPGRSFNPDSKFGSCTGPPPSEVKACFKNEGRLDDLERMYYYLRTRRQDQDSGMRRRTASL